ncbi:GxxExxY protein [Tichowtungia aerotolerans]|uniref:GxxExxY protein n=1 Tax=Tichowtungia aerotolerans TaxID=2697043 RepID=A0A6P1M6Z5_9BACT|nr:GxxExxY protein [Tichowtungia aerotolerans]QHI69621.1 GxxExxY protein [Tichowtungia aerotolerans]
MTENELSKEIIGAAIEVHRVLGPGLLESVYEEALCYELELRNIPYERQKYRPLNYKERVLKTELRIDLLVGKKVIVEVKAKETVHPVDKSQTLTYLRLSNLKLGLLINFHEPLLKDGITRIVNNL